MYNYHDFETASIWSYSLMNAVYLAENQRTIILYSFILNDINHLVISVSAMI